MPLLFSYGTLQQDNVRPTTCTGDSGARVAGTVFEITDLELSQADRYEVSAYVRVLAPLASGRRAWAYVDARSVPEQQEAPGP